MVTVVGTPQLTMETGATIRHASYVGGSGTNSLAFVYTVQTGDMSPDLEYKSALALDVNGGSIRDLALNNATLTLPTPGAAGSLSANKDIDVYTTTPLIFSYVRQNPQTSITNANALVFRASFSGTVTAVDVDDFAVGGGATATATNVSTVNSSTYDITISGGNLAGFNGVVNLNLSNTQNITDPDGVHLPMGEPAIDESYTLENTAPSVLSSLRADPEVTTADVVHYIVTFSEPVVNVGVSDFALTKAGASGAVITNISGSGTTYTVNVNTGNSYGTIRLDVPVTATIEDTLGNSIGGLPYVGGQSYTINKSPTFVDVLPSHPYWKDIEILSANGSDRRLQYQPAEVLSGPDHGPGTGICVHDARRLRGGLCPQPICQLVHGQLDARYLGAAVGRGDAGDHPDDRLPVITHLAVLSLDEAASRAGGDLWVEDEVWEWLPAAGRDGHSVRRHDGSHLLCHIVGGESIC